MKLPNLIQLGKRLGLSTLIWLSLPTSIVKAQVTPDGSLESAVQQIQELMKINGGQRSGNNLFHSFEEFNIPAGMEAAFENATDIENIFTRVTGDSVSAIDGILSAQGGANLFLMNPNGIVFGTDASINIGGSFIATTADSIQFGDGQEFAASEAENDALINVRFPVAFGFNEEPGGSITVNGAGNQITPSSSTPPVSPTQIESNNQGLKIKPGNTIGLVGSGIDIDGGTLTAENGRVEIGSVGSGTVNIQAAESGFTFDFGDVSSYQNIDLANQAALNASGEEVGLISLTGNNITFADGSLALITNLGNSTSEGININAAETFSLLGTSSDGNYSSAVRSETFGTGKGASIDISTENLIVKNAGILSGITYTEASGGNLKIDARGSIELLENDGINPNRQTNATGGLGSTTYGSGDAGNVLVSAERLRIIDGSSIGSPTVGAGNGGNITVKANSINLVGTNKTESAISAILAASASTGNAGNVTIDTSKLSLADGAIVDSSSIAKGSAGNVTVNASELIEITGQSQNPTDPQASAISSSVIIPNEAFQQALGLNSEPSGQAGNVAVNTSLLTINEGGEIRVKNEGIGNAGTLAINADNVDLDKTGNITAASATGTGGNIELNTDNLQIDNESQITARAGSEGGGGNININATNISAKKNSAISANAVGGDGGNITIDTETLLGLQNSDITANAVEGDGGKITITADVIVGFEERAELTELSDITASSEFGASGMITIDSPESSSDEELEVAAREAADQNLARDFVESCSQGRGKFTYTAMGIPQNPDRYFDDSGEYGSEEVSDVVPNYPPIGFPQSEQQRRDTEKVRQNRLRQQQGQQQSLREVRGQMVVTDISPKTGKGYPIIYSETNTVPPRLNGWRQPGAPREEVNAIQINPNGEQYMVAIAEIQHPQDQVCTTTSNSASDR